MNLPPPAPSTAPPKIFLSVKDMVSDGFNHAKFVSALAMSDLPEADKQYLSQATHPDALVSFNPEHPEYAIARQANNLLTARKFTSEGEAVRASEESPIYQMWDEVWQQTNAHYKDEIAEYTQTVSAADRQISFYTYPQSTPPLILTPVASINAAMCLGETPDMYIFARVNKGFMEKLTPDEQKAVLFHEAQHGMEAMLNGRTPWQHRQHEEKESHLDKTPAHLNTYSQSMERRADDLSVQMGYGAGLISAFDKIDAETTEEQQHEGNVGSLLRKAGFSYAPKKIAGALEGTATARGIAPQSEKSANANLGAIDAYAKNYNSIIANARPDTRINRTLGAISGALRESIGADGPGKGTHPASQARIREVETNMFFAELSGEPHELHPTRSASEFMPKNKISPPVSTPSSPPATPKVTTPQNTPSMGR